MSEDTTAEPPSWSVEASVARAAERVARDQGLDLGLAKLVEELDAMDDADAIAARGATGLRERLAAVDAAADQLRRAATEVDYLAGQLPFTAEGWSNRRARLTGLATQPAEQLRTWLADWSSAAAARNVDALERLEEPGVLPAGTDSLLAAARAARVGLAAYDYASCHRMLERARRGLGGFGPPLDVRRRLGALQVRLALATARLDEAATVLDELDADGATPASTALRAHLVRARRTAAKLAAEQTDAATDDEPDETGAGASDASAPVATDEAAVLLGMAQRDDPTDLTVALECIAQFGATRFDDALDAAGEAVRALPSLVDLERQFAPLIEAVPAHIWLAVARRAQEEGLESVVDDALRNAEDRYAEGTDYALGAQVAEARLAAATRRDDRPGMFQAALEAGQRWEWADDMRRALQPLETAVALDPDDATAAMFLANCLTALYIVPLAPDPRPHLERVVALVAQHADLGALEDELSWGYQVEVIARTRLAVDQSEDPADQRWRALLASCRLVAASMNASDRWVVLSGAAQVLDLYQVGAATARYAVATAIENGDDLASAQSNLVQAVANVGQIDEASAMADVMLAGQSEAKDPWLVAVRAYCELQSGDAEAALARFHTTELDNSWDWATGSLLSALIIKGRFEEARAEAAALRSSFRDRIDDVDARMAEAKLYILLGVYEQARAYAEPAAPSSAREEILGTVAWLQGDGSPIEHFTAMVEQFRSPRDLNEYHTVTVPYLEGLARLTGVALPDLTPVDRAVDGRRRALLATTDPVAELRAAPVETADPSVVALTKQLGAALLDFASDDLDEADAALADSQDRAAATLRLDIASQRASAEAAAAAEPEGDGVVETAPTVEEPVHPLQIVLPPSWFTGLDDPVNQHPIFLTYMPELRARSQVEVPSANVSTSEDLEPAGYAIVLDDEGLERGETALGSRVLPSAAAELLPAELAAEAVPGPVPDFVVLPAEKVAPGTLAELVSMAPDEFVIDRVGRVLAARAEAESAPAEG